MIKKTLVLLSVPVTIQHSGAKGYMSKATQAAKTLIKGSSVICNDFVVTIGMPRLNRPGAELKAKQKIEQVLDSMQNMAEKYEQQAREDRINNRRDNGQYAEGQANGIRIAISEFYSRLA